MSETADGVITPWNAAAERLVGYPVAEAVGQHIYLIVSPDRREDEERVIAQVRNATSIQSYETVRIDEGGASTFRLRHRRSVTRQDRSSVRPKSRATSPGKSRGNGGSLSSNRRVLG